jgi:hypothetical protein
MLPFGATLDIVVPDAERILHEYVRRHHAGFPAHRWWRPA